MSASRMGGFPLRPRKCLRLCFCASSVMTRWGSTPMRSRAFMAVSTHTIRARSRSSARRWAFFLSDGPADTMMPGYPANLPKRSLTLPESKRLGMLARMLAIQLCSNSKRVNRSLIFEVKNRLMSMNMVL